MTAYNRPAIRGELKLDESDSFVERLPIHPCPAPGAGQRGPKVAYPVLFTECFMGLVVNAN